MENFQELQLPEKLQKALDGMKFTTPTPVQAQTIPLALEGKDVMGTAQTGTGKTGAFGIPLAAKLINNPEESLIVLTPTRELATQVHAVFQQLLSEDRSIKTALLIGGESIDRQFRQLKNKPRVIVGTPGRINDHLKRRSLDLRQTRSLVLDESDLMLDMGFDIQIETIIEQMHSDRQTLMFSATLPRQIEKMAARYLNNPVRVSVGQQSTPGEGIKQETVMLQDSDKYPQLLEQLDQRAGSVIIFVKTKRGADKLSRRLNDEHHKCAAIHGDLRQSKRDMVLKGFRNQKYRIMVATDVAARGLDVPHIRHVINFDLPQCPEDYVHRIGRTGRAGEKGNAVSFITRSDRGKWGAIERLLDPNAKKESSSDRHSSRGGARRNQGGGSFSRGAPRRDGGTGYGNKSWGGDRDSSRGNSRGGRDDRGNSFSRDSDSRGGGDFKKKSWGDRDSSRGNSRDGGSDFKKKSWGDRDSSRGNSRDDSRGDRGNSFSRDSGSRGGGSDFKKKSWGDRDSSRGDSRGDRGGNSFSRDSDNRGGSDFKKKTWGDRDSSRGDSPRGDSSRGDRGSFNSSDRRDSGSSFKKKTWGDRDSSRGGAPAKGSSWRDRDSGSSDSRGGSRGGFDSKPSFSKGKPGGDWKRGGSKPRARA